MKTKPVCALGWQEFLRRAICALFLVCFGLIFLVNGIRGGLHISGGKIALFILLGAGLFALCKKVLPLAEGMRPSRWNALFYGGLGLLLLLQLASGFLTLQDLTTSPFDTEAVLRTATQLAQGMVPAEYNDYFSTMDTNVLCMFVLYWMYRVVYLVFGSTAPQWAVVLNVLFLFVAAFAVCHTAKRLWGRKGALAALVLCLLFLPYYIFTSFVYTDTMAAPLVACSIWGFVALRQRWAFKKPIQRLAGSFGLGALVGAAFLMKGNALLLYPAFGLYLLLSLELPGLIRRRWRTALATVALFLAGSALCITGFNAYKWNCGLLDFSHYDSLHTPVTHWLMMGLEHDGAFSSESYQYTAQFPTIAEKKAGNLVRIRSNLEHLFTSPKSLAWLMFTKAQTDWMDGLYTAPQMVAFAPVQRTWLHEWFSVDGSHSDLTDNFGQAFYWVLWAGIFAGCWRGVQGRQWAASRMTLLCNICLLGNLAFLSLWEANARYPFCYSCCLLLPLAGIMAHASRSEKKQKDFCRPH